MTDRQTLIAHARMSGGARTLPACQRGTGATCGECAAHHAPQGTQALLPLDEGHGVERRPRDVSADPLPW